MILRSTLPPSHGKRSEVPILPGRAKRLRGMTLVEMMVAVSIGFMALLGMEIVFVNSTFSFADMGNYMLMDRASRNALDHITRDVRNSADLTSFTANQLVFKYAGTTNLLNNS